MAGRNTNNELLLKLLEENAATKQEMADSKNILKDVSTDLKRFVSMAEKMHHTIYGNGQAGLVDRVAALEEWQQKINGTMHEAKGGSRVIAFLFGAAMTFAGVVLERFLR